MFSWLIIAIVAYLFFSLSFFGDKLMLSGHQNAKLYTFYVGMLSLVVIFLIPFVRLEIPNFFTIFWIALAAITSLAGIYSMFVALEKFEVSKVMPTIGGLQPLFILVLTWVFWGFQNISIWQYVAFGLLLLGSLVISVEKKPSLTTQYLKLTLFSSFMFSLNYVFSKLVFEALPFLEGVIWILIFTFIFVLPMLLDGNMRSQIFTRKSTFNRRAGVIFLLTQLSGGVANLLQSLAISLAPVAYLAIVNALKGVQYVFLFLLTLLFSIFFPRIFKEKISKKVLAQKIVSIAIIATGLVILVNF